MTEAQFSPRTRETTVASSDVTAEPAPVMEVAGPQVPDEDVRLGDRITGGPVWGGFVVALAVWITLEILLIAVELAGVGAVLERDPDFGRWWWSLIVAVVALFAGGLTAGAASRWRGVGDGALLGVTVWAVTVVALLLLSAVGAGVGFGAFGQLLGTGRAAAGGANLPASIVDTARDAAWIALLALGLTLAAAVAGGAVAARGRSSRRRAHR